MSGLYPLSRMQQFDRNGKLLDGAQLRLYDGGTTTPRVGFADGSLSTPLPWPILADASGRLPLIYLDDGFYRHRLVTKAGTMVFDDDGLPVLSTGSGGSGTTVDPNALFGTRDIKIRFGEGKIDGYVPLNGRTIGSPGSGATERANLDTQSLFEEMWPFANISIVGGKGASASADWAADKQLVLPDAAGRLFGGMDDLGAGRKNRITDATITGANLPGSAGGVEKVALTVEQHAAHNHPASATTSVSASTSASGNHQHTGNTGGMNANQIHSHQAFPQGGAMAIIAGNGQSGGEAGRLAGAGSMLIGNVDLNHGHPFTTDGAGNHVHTVTATASTSVTTTNTGGGQAHTNMPPALLLMIYIRL